MFLDTARTSIPTTDARQVALGDVVWVNNHSSQSISKPAKVRLTSIRVENDWPFGIEWKEENRNHNAWWAKIYKTEEDAFEADPTPEIRRLQARLITLESYLDKQESPHD